MKTTTKITILLSIFSMQISAQYQFLNRKYTKGRFIEKTIHLKQFLKTSTSNNNIGGPPNFMDKKDNVAFMHQLDLKSDSLGINQTIMSSPVSKAKPTLKNIISKYYSKDTFQAKIAYSHIESYNTVLINDNKNRYASLKKEDGLILENKFNEKTLKKDHVNQHSRKSILKLFFEWNNLKQLRFNDFSIQGIALSLIDYYQKYVSPQKGFQCAHKGLYKNQESCSEYGKTAIKQHGFLEGTYLTYKRLKQCEYSFYVLKNIKASNKMFDDDLELHAQFFDICP